jgi:hypothetical protein
MLPAASGKQCRPNHHTRKQMMLRAYYSRAVALLRIVEPYFERQYENIGGGAMLLCLGCRGMCRFELRSAMQDVGVSVG